MKRYVLGLDIGTTCAKALIVDEGGLVVGAGSHGYGLISSGAVIEQDSADWIRAAATAVRTASKGLDADLIAGISMSTQGGSTVAIDKNGAPIGNALTWMDTRAQAEAEEVKQELGDEYIYRVSGWRVNPALDAAKIRHMKKDSRYQAANAYWTTLEILNFYLCRNPAIDPTNAAIRQLYNIEENRWDAKLLGAAGVALDELPIVLPTGTLVGKLCPEAAADMGLAAGIPIYNGAHDQYAAAIGAGAVAEGDMLLSAGTTWVLMGISHEPLFTQSYIAPGKHPVPGLYGAIASLTCSGASLEWFKNNFLREEFDEMNRVAAERREKAAELCYYPYMAGANYPLWTANARGAFTGITLEHDRFDFARSIMEGVAFGVRRGVQDFRLNGADVGKITIMGGAAKSPLWCQIIADATDVVIQRLNQADVCALGAAAIALVGVGICKDYEAAARLMVHPEAEYLPQAAQKAWYDEKFLKFDGMWRHMQKFYEAQL